jgi:type I restriction enzyme S subunit
MDTYYGGEIPWLRTQEVTFNRITDTEIKISDAGLKNSAAKWVPANSVIVAMYGHSAGRSAITEIPLTTNQACCNLVIDDTKADFRFVFYALLMSYDRLKSLSKGAAQNNLNAAQVKAFEINVPSVYTQRTIGDLLSSYDDLIENNRRRMALFEESARLLYREWFVRLRFPGYEHTPIVDGVPQGWERKTLGDLCSEIRDMVLPEALEPDTPYIGLEHIPRRSISLNEWGTAGQVTSSKSRFKAGEIIFGKIRPYFHKVGVAFVDGVASSDAIVVRPANESLHGLVLMTMSSDEFVAVTAQQMKEGSKMPRADWKQMQAYSVPLPPSGLLDNFNDVIEPIVEQLKSLSFSNQKLRAARDLLLPRLMSGELAV